MIRYPATPAALNKGKEEESFENLARPAEAPQLLKGRDFGPVPLCKKESGGRARREVSFEEFTDASLERIFTIVQQLSNDERRSLEIEKPLVARAQDLHAHSIRLV